ncbi:MAG: hypothetical protein M3536_05060 [Actinomycetota bacterium]|nr:hypothetical protein [Actinomycetota bacterium]
MDLASGVLRERSWSWLATRISGLLNKVPVIDPHNQKRTIPQTRLALALNPPK